MNTQLPYNTPRQRLKIYKLVLNDILDIPECHHALCFKFGACIREKAAFSELETLLPEWGLYFTSVYESGPLKWKNQYYDWGDVKTNPWRIKVLKACIKRCETQINKAKP